MELPAITLPTIDLPFDIPVLIHPVVDHFAIALPVIILLFELINFIAKKRTISIISFLLLLLVVVVSVAAYFTGLVDGKEAFDTLSEAGQAELKEHQILGTYLMFASVLVFFFKLLTLLTAKGLIKALYFLFLLLFVAGVLQQGKDGGELVFEYGANVEKVAVLDDVKEVQEETKAQTAAVKEETAAVKVETPVVTPPTPAKVATPIFAPEPAEEVTPVVLPTPGATETQDDTISSVRTQIEEVSEEVLSTVEETVEKVIEVVPSEVEQPQIATH